MQEKVYAHDGNVVFMAIARETWFAYFIVKAVQ